MKRVRAPPADILFDQQYAKATAADRAKRNAANVAFAKNTFVLGEDGHRVSLKALGPIADIIAFRATLPTVGHGVRVAPSLIVGAGNGLFAERAFAKGEIVTFYDGPIAEYAPPASLPQVLRSHNRVLVMHRYMIIGNAPSAELGAIGRGGGALMNDARNWVANNVAFFNVDSAANVQHFEHYFDPTAIDPFQRIVVARADRDIRVGEELCVSYGASYWTHPIGDEASSTALVYVHPRTAPPPSDEQPKRRRMAPTPLHCA